MATEIERKFLLKNDHWRAGVTGTEICQGYAQLPNGIFRVRIYGQQAFLTVKGKLNGLSRTEFEYEIPVADARAMLETVCEKPYIQKTRFLVKFDDKKWEIDEFYAENDGLIVAEIELESEDKQFELPEWAGKEVSEDLRYYNSNLIKNPYCNWK
jgi:CYTH domain-containing protein